MVERIDRIANISIHALREEGDPLAAPFLGRKSISIHALREEGDYRVQEQCGRCPAFLSTPSARRATLCILPGNVNQNYFYPRPPRGGRHLHHKHIPK